MENTSSLCREFADTNNSLPRSSAPSIGQTATLDVEGYQHVASLHDGDEMRCFIQRLISMKGGHVRDEEELRCFALHHSGIIPSSRYGFLILSYRHLLSELSCCPWVDWSQSLTLQVLPKDEASCSCGLVQGAVQPCCTEGPLPPPAFVGSNFISVASDGINSAPSAPPMQQDENAAASPGGHDSPRTVQLDSVEMGSRPFDDLGPLAIYSPPWELRYFVARRPFMLVLRHPTDSTCGLMLCESHDRAKLIDTAQTITRNLGLQDMGRVDQGLYMSIANDPQMQATMRRNDVESGAAGDDNLASSSASDEPVPSDTQENCPICFCEIEASSAVMRCSGCGGRHHYFHSACMRQWIDRCRAGRAMATCPVCRGHVQFNAQRLEEFLAGEQSMGLASEDRTYLQQCVDLMHNTGLTWGDAFTLDNAKYYGGIFAAGSWGFMIGFTQPPLCLQDQMYLDNLPREHRIAQGVGWVVGLVAKIAREYYREKRRREEWEEERKRRRV